MQKERDHRAVRQAFPAQLVLAEQHAQAARIGLSSGEDCCPCCSLPLQCEQLSFFSNSTDEIGFLGPGVPLYFTFVSDSCKLVFLAFLVAGLYGLVACAQGSYCDAISSNGCYLSLFTWFSQANILDSDMAKALSNFSNLAAVLASCVFLHYIRYNARRTNRDVDARLVSPSDYSLLIYNLPDDYDEKQVRGWFEEWHSIKGYRQEMGLRIVPSWKLDQYLATREARQKLNYEIRKCLAYHNAKNALPEGITPETLQKMDGDLARLTVQLGKKADETKVRGRFVIAVLELAAMRALIEYDFGKGPMRKGNSISRALGLEPSVERAPEPGQLYWQNSHYGALERLGRTGAVYLCVSVLVGITQYISYLISVEQLRLSAQTGSGTWVAVLSVLLGVLVSVLNGVVAFAIGRLTLLEKPLTESHFLQSLTFKISFTQFINTAISLFLSNVILGAKGNFYQQGGLIDDATVSLLMNALIGNLADLLLDADWLAKLVLGWRERGRLAAGESELSQGELNDLLEGVRPDFCSKYAYVIKTLWLTGLLSPVIPLASALCMLALLFTLAAQKYLVFYRYSRPKMISAKLNCDMIELLEWFPVWLSFGNFFFFYYVYKYDFTQYPALQLAPSLASLVLALANLKVPNHFINKRLFPLDDDEPEAAYSEAESTFLTDYWKSNPIHECRGVDLSARTKLSLRLGEILASTKRSPANQTAQALEQKYRVDSE